MRLTAFVLLLSCVALNAQVGNVTMEEFSDAVSDAEPLGIIATLVGTAGRMSTCSLGESGPGVTCSRYVRTVAADGSLTFTHFNPQDYAPTIAADSIYTSEIAWVNGGN